MPEKTDLVEKAKKCFKFASDSEAKQRERERDDLRFQIPELQWDDDARKARAGGVVGVQVTPARPMLSISLLTQPMQLIRNQAEQAHLGVEIHPVSEDAEEELAEVKQGLYRRIERDSNANVARLWALDRAIQAGRGWYRINTKWDEQADNPSDQEIVVERIYDQASVYVDPTAQREDFSDARWAMITAWMPVEDFKEEYPQADVPLNDQAFASWQSEDPEWVRMEGDAKAVRVAEMFYKVYDRKEKKVKGKKWSRESEEPQIKYCKVTSHDVLEEQDWNGHYIPIIPVLGRELQPFDGERRWEGMVRQSRDGQKMFNYAASTLVERMALEPKAPFIGAEGQFAGHENEWMQANTRNMPFLEYKPTSLGDKMTPPPARAQVDGAGMSLALQALMQAKQFIQSSTSVYAPSLGDVPDEPTAQSGRAILALQQQSDAGTGHYLQTMASVSMMYEAKVILDLLPTIYDRPGRITQVLGTDDEPKMVMLNRPFVMGPDGRPMPAPPPGAAQPMGQPGPPAMPAPMGGPPGATPPPPGGPSMGQAVPAPPEVKNYDLNKGQYSISVSVGKSFQTRLQEGQAEIGGVLEKAPQLMPMIGDLYFKFRDFPGHKEIADRLAKIREKQFPGLGDDEEGGMTLDQAMMQIENMQGQMQEMGQQLQAASQAMEVDRAKQEATMAKAQMDNQTKMAISQQDAQIKMLIAKMDAQTKVLLEQLKAQSKAVEGEAQRDHEADADQFEADHETAMAVITTRPPAGSTELEEIE